MHLRLHPFILIPQQANIRNALVQHRQAIQPHPERQPTMARWIYLQPFQQRLRNTTALQDLDGSAVIYHVHFDSTFGVVMRAVAVDPCFVRHGGLQNIANQAQQMLVRRQLRITEDPDIHLMRLRAMPAVTTVSAKGDTGRGQQYRLPRLPTTSRTLQRRRNLTGGLRTQQRVLIDPTGMFAAQCDFSGVIAEQPVVFLGRHHAWACL